MPSSLLETSSNGEGYPDLETRDQTWVVIELFHMECTTPKQNSKKKDVLTEEEAWIVNGLWDNKSFPTLLIT